MPDEYGIDPRGLGAGLDEGLMGAAPIADEGTAMTASLDQVRRAHNSLRTVSEETGGFAVVNRTDINTAFDDMQSGVLNRGVILLDRTLA